MLYSVGGKVALDNSDAMSSCSGGIMRQRMGRNAAFMGGLCKEKTSCLWRTRKGQGKRASGGSELVFIDREGTVLLLTAE